MTSITSPTVLSRRRALLALAGLGAITIGGTRAVAAQEGSGPSAGMVRTAQDAAGPVVVASGTGTATAPADRVLIQLIARSIDGYDTKSNSGMSEQTDGTPTAAPGPEALQAAVDVLLAAGIGEDDIIVVASDGVMASAFFGMGSGMVGARVTGDALAELPTIMRDAAAALIEQGLMVDQPMAMFLADGCADLRGEALTAAVAAARADADALAAALGVEVTTLHRATEFGYMYGPYAYVSGPSDACDALPDLAELPRTYLPTYDSTAPLEFSVTASIELTMNVVEPGT